MQIKILLLFLFVLTSDIGIFGKTTNGTKSGKLINKNNNNHRINNERKKRSLDERSLPYLLPVKEELIDKLERYKSDLDENSRKNRFEFIKDTPFWGTRGRRDSASDESVADLVQSHSIYNVVGTSKNLHKFPVYIKQRLDELEAPFWGNRGRRASEESGQNDIETFGPNRGRRQEDDPFWGTRGRRHEEFPFWGNIFMKNRIEDNEPFWGNRGRRESFEPFWGNRGKKKLRNLKTFKEESEPFWGNQDRRKVDLKESLVKAINDVENNLQYLAITRSNNLKSLLNGSNNDYLQTPAYFINEHSNDELSSNKFEQNTVHDDRIFAEEPHFILVERSSRSSEEDDPFYISRGKKYKYIDLTKTSRGRRGALEEIVKSVRNDPYYIARGKKAVVSSKLGSQNKVFQNKLLKAKDLICATIELLAMKNKKNIVKRQVNDNERDRRTILKKLALQLQMDPYFVSRGKKNIEPSVDYNAIEKFLNQISVSCN